MANIYDLADTWNDGATTFAGIKLNVTDTASASGSLLMDLQVGGSSKFSVSKGGAIESAGITGTSQGSTKINFNSTYIAVSYAGTDRTIFGVDDGASMFKLPGLGFFGWAPSTTLSATYDLALFRDAAGTLAQRNSTNPQAFRVYNSYTDGSNYERGAVHWVSNVFRVGTYAAGTGTGRTLTFLTSGVERWSINAGTGHLLAATDNTYDIGASGATRPRNIYAGTAVNTPYLVFGSFGGLEATSNGAWRFRDATASGIALVAFGGSTSSFPALKRSTTSLQARLADDSAFTNVQGKLTTETAYTAGAPTATGYIVLYDSTGTAYKIPAEAL